MILSLDRVLTCHGTILGLAGRPRLLVALRPDSVPPDCVVVAARRPTVRDEFLVLTAHADTAVEFSIPPDPQRRRLHILRVAVRQPPDTFSLSTPPTHASMVASPPESSRPLDPVGLFADIPQAWEEFRLQRMPESEANAGAMRRIEAAETLLNHKLTAETIGLALRDTDDDALNDVLEAVLPLLPTSELDQLATWLLEDATLRLKLAQLYPLDPWASAALPQLAAWIKDRWPKAAFATFEADAATGRPELPARPLIGQMANLVTMPAPPVASAIILGPSSGAVPGLAKWERGHSRRVGPEFDVVAYQGLYGVYPSLPYACNARARRRIDPDRNVAIVATARNEGIYLLEWIAYYRLLGVERFLLYSNDNLDESDGLLAALADAGVITWFDNRIAQTQIGPQHKVYGHALNILPDTLAFRWALLLDIDEFLVLDTSRVASMTEFARWHEDRRADTVAINWTFVAPEQTVPADGPLTRRNRRLLQPRHVGDGWRLVKSMSRPNRIIHSEAHVPFAEEREALITRRPSGELYSWHNPPEGFPHSPKFADDFAAGLAVVYHYHAKSPEEYLWKTSRNGGDHQVIAEGGMRTIDEIAARVFMIQMEAPDLKLDERCISASPDLEGEMARLQALPGVESALRQVHARYAARLQEIRNVYRSMPELSRWNDDSRRFLALAGVDVS